MSVCPGLQFQSQVTTNYHSISFTFMHSFCSAYYAQKYNLFVFAHTYKVMTNLMPKGIVSSSATIRSDAEHVVLGWSHVGDAAVIIVVDDERHHI